MQLDTIRHIVNMTLVSIILIMSVINIVFRNQKKNPLAYGLMWTMAIMLMLAG